MRILITGVAGLLGGNFARWLMENTEYDIHGIDDLSCGLRSNIPHGLPWDHIHLGSHSNQLNSLVSHFRPDIIYHFAAYAAECLSPFVRQYNYTNNLVATAEVINACINHEVERLVFTSSMAVYGPGSPPFQEDHKPQPMDPYGVAKYACEMDLAIAGEQHGLDWCILRPHNIYGPGQVCTQKYRNVFGIWMDRIQHNEPLLIYGDGQQQRAFSYIDDMLPAIHQAGIAPQASKQIINLGGAHPCTIEQAAGILIKITRKGSYKYAESRHEVHKAWCTVDKSIKLLGYEEKTPLPTGLLRMWSWAQNTLHESPSLPPIEIEEGLPSYWR